MTGRMYDEVLARVSSFLAAELPQHSPSWVQELVVPHVNWRTRSKIHGMGGGAMNELDLADTLRVAEKNWACIAQRHSFPSRVFGLIKGLQMARNAYAHRSTEVLDFQWEGYDQRSVDLLFRYLDSAALDMVA